VRRWVRPGLKITTKQKLDGTGRGLDVFGELWKVYCGIFPRSEESSGLKGEAGIRGGVVTCEWGEPGARSPLAPWVP
jgi:hypothetical protein